MLHVARPHGVYPWVAVVGGLLALGAFLTSPKPAYAEGEGEARWEGEGAREGEAERRVVGEEGRDAKGGAATITFVDANLEAAIREHLAALGADPGPTIESDDVVGVGLTVVDAAGRDISSLEGIQYCEDLTDLSLPSNQIADLTPLSTLANLTYINLTLNQVENIEPLSGLANLQVLYLNANVINGISAISSLTSIQRLGLSDNNITDVSALAPLTNLVDLFLGGNQITEVNAIADMTALELLGIEENNIAEIGPLSGLFALKDLTIYSNRISNLTPLQNLNNLESLWIYGNRIADISPIGNLDSLLSLELSFNEISDVSALAGLHSLDSLSLAGNRVGDIGPLSSMTQMSSLYLYNNQIADVGPLTNLTNLSWLSLTNNPIQDIAPVSGLVNLIVLELSGVGLSDLTPLSPLVELRQLNLADNFIQDLTPLPGKPHLTHLSLARNQIQDLSGLDGLTALGVVDLSGNQITDSSLLGEVLSIYELDLSNNPINDVSHFFGWPNSLLLNVRGASNFVNCEQAPDLDARELTEVLYDPCLPEYTLTLTATPGGSILALTPQNGFLADYTAGTTVALQATPDTGYFFSGWSGANGAEVSANQITMDADKTVAAQFGQENTAPVITLNGPQVVTFECGVAYVDLGATAFDAEEGDISPQIIVTGTVNSQVRGDFTLTYNLTDSGGLAANPVTRTVQVRDTQAPELALLGPNPQVVECGSDYVEFGASAVDTCEDSVAVEITEGVAPAGAGSYTVSYSADDGSGNGPVTLNRTVLVEDTIAPVITVCPQPRTLPVDNDCAGVVPNLVNELQASDSCGGELFVEQTPAAGTRVTAPVTVQLRVVDVSENETTCEVLLTLAECAPRLGNLKGAITSVVDGGALECASVLLQDDEGNEYFGTSSFRGQYVVLDVPVGRYSVTATSVGFGQQSGTVTILEDQTVTRNFSLTSLAEAGSFSGRVLDAATDNSIAGARIEVAQAGVALEIRYSCATGEFEFAAIESKGSSDEFTVTYSATGYESLVETISIPPGANVQETARLNKVSVVASLVGVVYGKNSEPMPGVRVEVGTNQTRQQATTNDLGAYHIELTQAERDTGVRATAACGYEDYEGRVTIPESSTPANLDLTLIARVGEICPGDEEGEAPATPLASTGSCGCGEQDSTSSAGDLLLFFLTLAALWVRTTVKYGRIAG